MCKMIEFCKELLYDRDIKYTFYIFHVIQYNTTAHEIQQLSCMVMSVSADMSVTGEAAEDKGCFV